MDGFVSQAVSGLEAAVNGELLQSPGEYYLAAGLVLLKGPVDHPLPVMVM